MLTLLCDYPLQHKDYKPVSGFTLLELLLVISVIGILMAIALPGYQQSQQKARRVDAKVMLMRLATYQERFFFTNNQYTGDIGHLLGSLPNSTSIIDSDEGYYRIELSVAASGHGWSMTASAIGKQLDDKECLNFYLDNFGKKTAKNHNGEINNNCW
jgi:type IV pilus assembly protein PilE